MAKWDLTVHPTLFYTLVDLKAMCKMGLKLG